MIFLKKASKGLPALFAVVILSLSIIGISFAHWTDVLTLEGKVTTGTLCAEFTPPVTTNDQGLDWTCDVGFLNILDPKDNPRAKDIGSSSSALFDDDVDGHFDRIVVTFTNMYPCYYDHIAFWVNNCGTIPMKICYVEVIWPTGSAIIHDGTPSKIVVDYDDDDDDDFEMRWGDNFGKQIDPGPDYAKDISWDIHFLNGLEQRSELTITIKMYLINWNEDCSVAIPS